MRKVELKKRVLFILFFEKCLILQTIYIVYMMARNILFILPVDICIIRDHTKENPTTYFGGLKHFLKNFSKIFLFQNLEVDIYVINSSKSGGQNQCFTCLCSNPAMSVKIRKIKASLVTVFRRYGVGFFSLKQPTKQRRKVTNM